MSLIATLGVGSMVFCAWFTWREANRPSAGGQSPMASIVEAWVNIVIGFSLNFLINLAMIPLMTDGAKLTLSNNWWGGWCFTALSMLRQYGIRRWFNQRIHLFAARTAEKLS